MSLNGYWSLTTATTRNAVLPNSVMLTGLSRTRAYRECAFTTCATPVQRCFCRKESTPA